MFFKKNEEQNKKVLPVNEIMDMRQRGMSNQQIIQALRSMGYSLTDIKNALSQAEIKGAVNEPLPPPTVSPPPMNMPQSPQPQVQMPQPEIKPEIKTPELTTPQISEPKPIGGVSDDLVDELQRIIEKIIEEKWKDVDKKIDELDVWKASVDQKVNNAINRIKEFEKRLDEFSATLLKREGDFKKSMDNVNVEMQAVEKMMGKLIPSLADEIKELRDVINKMKTE